MKPLLRNPPMFLYKGKLYPNYLKHGNAADYIMPIAEQFCRGKGLDIGGLQDCHFPGARIINLHIADAFHAFNLPDEQYSFIFCSHTLEHISPAGVALKYWRRHLASGGILFLYLPHPDMEYWLPENCGKHVNSFSPAELTRLVNNAGFEVIMCSQRDAFWSFSLAATTKNRRPYIERL